MDEGPYEERDIFKSYFDTLSPLFQIEGIDPVHFVASLLRMNGLEGNGWDTFAASFEFIQELNKLANFELPSDEFPHLDHTRLRLHLIGYANLVEMDAPYDIIMNLCRIRLRLPMSISPFDDPILTQPANSVAKPKKRSHRPPSPYAKIKKIKTATANLGLPKIGEIFDEFYFSVIRNAIDHSDYIIHREEFRMRKGRLLLGAEHREWSSVVPIKLLEGIILRTYCFYSAFFELEQLTRKRFAKTKGKSYPYDLQYKGLLEFLLDKDDMLCGFKIHWPNNSESVYRRTNEGSDPMNVFPGPDGLELMVGLYAKDPGSFSPLVSRGAEPAYTPIDGSDERPVWPGASGA